MCRKAFEYTKIQHVPSIDREIQSSFFKCEGCDTKLPLSKYNVHSQVCNDSYTAKPGAAPNQQQQYSSLRSQHSSQSNQSNSSRSAASSAASSARSTGSTNGNRAYTNRFTFKCPYCEEKNFSANGLINHCNLNHKDDEPNVVCPICTAMPWGDPNLKSVDFITHLNYRHKFDYDYFVDFDKDDDEMMQMAVLASMESLRIKGH
jgi:RING finger protein 166